MGCWPSCLPPSPAPLGSHVCHEPWPWCRDGSPTPFGSSWGASSSGLRHLCLWGVGSLLLIGGPGQPPSAEIPCCLQAPPFLRCFPGSLRTLLLLFPCLPLPPLLLTHPLGPLPSSPPPSCLPLTPCVTHTFPEPSQRKSLKFSSIGCLPAPSSLKIQLLKSWTGKKQGPGCGYWDLCPPLKEPLCPDQDTT